MESVSSVGFTRCCRLAAIAISFFGVSACSTDVAENLQPAPSAPPMQQVYLIQPGDSLDVKFVKNPELNEQPTVQPDGRISMLYAQNVLVGGRSMEDVQADLNAAYSKELKDPGISVNVKGPIFWHVYIGGQVAKPTDYTASGPTPSLSAAISYAGGILDTGDPKKIVLTRLMPDHTRKAYILDYLSAAQGKTPAGDIQLAAYDAIYIPKTGVADVYTAYNQYFKQFLPSYGIGYSLNGF
jgi:polysaccharide export outer membrane protein